MINLKEIERRALRLVEQEDKTRGKGQGVGKEKKGDGGVSKLICPKCGYIVLHTRGIPASETRCLKCNTIMKPAREKND